MSPLLAFTGPVASSVSSFFERHRLPGGGKLAAILTTGSILVSFALQYWPTVVSSVSSLFASSVTLQTDDRLATEVLRWVAANVLPRQHTRRLAARSEKPSDQRRETFFHGRRGRTWMATDVRDRIHYFPAQRNTWFFHGRRLFLMHLTRSFAHAITPPQGPFPGANASSEAMSIMCLGWSPTPIKKLLAVCRIFGRQQTESFVSVHTSSSSAQWDIRTLKPMRPLETIHFDEAVKRDLVCDLRSYLDPKTRRFYASRGIPYRRGYLLYGPPGTGKTSLCIALAGLVRLPLYVLRLPSIAGDGALESMFHQLEPRCIVLLEDIDALSVERHATAKPEEPNPADDRDAKTPNLRRPATSCSCTLSGLLNVLDGVTSQEGRIVIMTANEPERLDKALVRPGRIDKQIYLGHISRESARLMFLRMFAPEPAEDAQDAGRPASSDTLDMETESVAAAHENGGPAAASASALAASQNDGVAADSEKSYVELADVFAELIPKDTLTPAQLQEFMLTYRGSASHAVSNIEAWIEDEKVRMAAKFNEAPRPARPLGPGPRNFKFRNKTFGSQSDED